jgi:TolA-binding protein
MLSRTVFAAALLPLLLPASAAAQDVPGIEICTVEKTITRLGIDHQQKLDAANRQIEALKATVAGLQKRLEELPAQKKPVEDQKKPEPPLDPAKGATK